ncbi:MAG: MBOAT family protein [Myxococcota bacterium]
MTALEALRGSYAPHEPILMGWGVLGLFAVLGAGFGLMHLASKRPGLARVGSWLLVATGFGAATWGFANEPPGIRMLVIIGVVLYAMKAVVATEEVIATKLKLTPVEWGAWAAGWPGMAPWVFAGWRARDGVSHDPSSSPVSFLLRGLVRLAFGASLIVCAHLAWAATGSLILMTTLALPGISLVLHFGIFNLACAFWRALGVPVEALFVAPLASFHLKEFWGRRWNLPFTQMVQRAIFQPLRPVIGARGAALAGFVFSGLLHECAISMPVQEGFGMPMLYFAIHGALVSLERSTGLDDGLEKRPVLARAWTLFWLASPMWILFHTPFLKGIVWPLVGVHVP